MPPSGSALLSFVIPVKDEQGTLVGLVERILAAVQALGDRYAAEFILVDDGSTDRSWAIMNGLAARFGDAVTAIRLRRNFGKAAALEAGFREARGSIVFTMDADLQDDPAEIPAFLAKLAEGYDVVSGWKLDRQDPVSKTLPSKLFNFVTARLTGLALHDFNCGFKAYRRDVLDKIRLYGELHRYVPVLAHDLGYRVGEIPVIHHARRHGASKYGLERYLRGLIDLLTVHATTRYLKKPGHLFGGVGLAAGALGGVILSYLAVLWFLDLGPIGTRPLFFVGILLVILAIQLISLGVIAELLNRHTDARSTEMIIAERVNGSDSPQPASNTGLGAKSE